MKAPRAASALAVLALCSLLFGLMAVVAKAAAARLPGPQVAFVRFLFGLAACGLIATRRPLRARNTVGLALRGLSEVLRCSVTSSPSSICPSGSPRS